jgi:rhamnulokinase
MNYLAIDLGASSGRGIVGRFDGDRLTLEEIHRFSNDPVTVCGTLYWDILRILHEIKAAIGKCSVAGEKLKSLAIDTWGVDYGLIDKNGRLLESPVHYRDRRTDGIMERAYEVVPKAELYAETGIQFMPFNTLFQLWADKTGDPEKLERAHNVLLIPDLLNYFLTGERRTEYTIASTSMLLGPGSHDWNRRLIEKFGLPQEIFGTIEEPGTPVGPILREVVDETGGTYENLTVVHTAAHDTASAVVAVPAKERDFIYISSGTWSLMGTELASAETGSEAFAHEFTNEGGAEGKIRFLKNIMGLWLEQESRRQWAREGKSYTYDQLSEMAVASQPLRSLIDPSDPVFIAPGDMLRRIADYCKSTGQPVPETPGEVVRCIFDSLALCYRYTADIIDGILGKRTPYIHIVGGGVKEAPLCGFAASACGRPVYAGPVEATAIGNIAVQAIASGELKDVAEARECVRRSFEVKEYLPRDTDMWDQGYERFLKLINK